MSAMLPKQCLIPGFNNQLTPLVRQLLHYIRAMGNADAQARLIGVTPFVFNGAMLD